MKKLTIHNYARPKQLVAFGVFAILAGIAPASHAADPGNHPHYMHALADLRAARAFLAQPNEGNLDRNQAIAITRTETAAIDEIDRAIQEINRAAIDDDKNLRANPPIDVDISHRDRFGKVAALLAAAHGDLNYNEDDKAALGWRHAAIDHIIRAVDNTHKLMRGDFSGDFSSVAGAHPHYLHALSDLRTARIYLSHRDEHNVQEDEGRSISEIDQAIQEINRAAIDDGKNINYNAHVDANLSHRDRINAAIALLTSTQKDLSAHEDDKEALGWNRMAQQHVSLALQAATRASLSDYRDGHPFVPGPHAHFLHAIASLRAARGLLNHPDESNVVADEKAAIEAITEAIRFARQGAIDDGMDPHFNPPFATNQPRHNRLLQAQQLVHDAWVEMTHYPESDPQTRSSLDSALRSTSEAEAQINRAIADDRNDDKEANQ